MKADHPHYTGGLCVRPVTIDCAGWPCRGCKYRRAAPAQPAKRSVFDTQVGGKHYKGMVIQPAEYNIKNKLPWAEGNIVKYISRHRAKGGDEDIRKVIQMAQMILELEYPELPNAKTALQIKALTTHKENYVR